MTSRRTKKLATSAPDDKDLGAKEKLTRKRSPRMAAIWKKTLRPNPLKKLRLEPARATHTKIPKREPSTHSLVLHG
jgi:hypothetical protein